MRKVIGIAGKIASGKGIAAEHIISRYHAGCIDYSQFLYRVLDIFDVPHERKNINALSIFLRSAYGQGVFNNAVLQQLEKQSESIVAVTGIRREQELAQLRKIEGFCFLYIDSDIHSRYERNRRAARKPGDADMTFEQFVEKDSDDSNNTIQDLMVSADFIIDNNGTVDEFHAHIQQVITNCVGDSN